MVQPDVDCLLEHQFFGGPGLVDHCCLLPFDAQGGNPHQMGGDNSDRPSQDLQRTDAQGGNPHQAEPPLPQQGWWAGAAWMLDGRLEEGNPATSSDTP